MTTLPEPPAAPAAGQTYPDTSPLTDSVIQAAVNDALRKTFHRDDSPVPEIGAAPPVAQPGRPPMSQGATDASTLMLSGGVCTVLIGGAVSLVLYASGHADPVVVGLVFGAPTALALAIARLLRRAKQAMPDEIHNHISGPVHVDQRNVQNKNVGAWVKNTNE